MLQKKIAKQIDYFSEWKHLIHEGDVLLFKGESLYSRGLRIGGDSPYTHVGIASWHNDILECTEFHEKHGGRTINLENYIKLDSRQVDVFRPIPYFASLSYDVYSSDVTTTRVKFEGKLVTDCLRSLTGLPYGWKRIWWIAKHKLAGFRLFYDTSSTLDDTTSSEIVYPVCSTALAYCFSKNSYDLVSQRSDEWTEPADIARSTRIHKIFNIKKGILRIVG